MVARTSPQPTPTLLVFSDDWGRHPSSSQHLMKRLVHRYPVVWVNTIGTRAPRFDLATLTRAAGKLREWIGRRPPRPESDDSNAGPTVASPRMWPWFTRTIDRRINQFALSRQLNGIIGSANGPVVAVTTLPITADLVGAIPVARWVYYCVDDFSEWPGLDGATLKAMDELMLRRADRIVCVSERLREIAADAGRQSDLLTHGVDLDHWRCDRPCDLLSDKTAPTALFWGVVDRRMDTNWIRALSDRMTDGRIVFVGPQQDPDPELLALPRCEFLPPVAFDELPAFAAAADVLIMPYADLPVTRAMQPLKLKEYLATGRPVVSSPLPAVSSLVGQLDIAASAEDFADLVQRRLLSGTPVDQVTAREALKSEGWDAKAAQLEQWMLEDLAVAPAPKSEVIA